MHTSINATITNMITVPGNPNMCCKKILKKWKNLPGTVYVHMLVGCIVYQAYHTGYSGNLNEQIHYAPHESERSSSIFIPYRHTAIIGLLFKDYWITALPVPGWLRQQHNTHKYNYNKYRLSTILFIFCIVILV